MEKIKKAAFSIPFKWVAITAYAILIVPILIFFFGWLKWYLAILFSGILLFGAYWAIKKDYWENKDRIELPISIFIGAGIVFLLWILVSGSCYFSVGGYDTVWRNTTLNDLVNYDWPVYYPEKNGYLCYYFMFWLVPAIFGKLFGGIFVAYVALIIYFVLILMVVFLLISYYFKDYNKFSLKIIILFMVMWSGVNILGVGLINTFGLSSLELTLNLNDNFCDSFWRDGIAFNFYYRANETIVSECYNQVLVWLVVPLMLQNRQIHNYAFLGLLLFPFSPWGTVGIALVMVADAIYWLVKEKSIKKFLKEVVSIPNICAICSVAIIFLPFTTAEGQFGKSDGLGFRMLPINQMSIQIWQVLLIFLLCEFGIYAFMIWKKYRKDFLFYSIIFFLILIPFFQIGNNRDFCHYVSMPSIYILMIYMIGYVKEVFSEKNDKLTMRLIFKNAVLIILLLASFTTPIFHWMNKIGVLNANNSVSIQDKSVSTFADLLGYGGPFGAPISSNVDDTVFFKYLCKPVNKENAKRLPLSDNLSEIRNIDDIDEYFDYLADKECTVFIAIRDIPGFNLTQDTIERVKRLGFDSGIDVLSQKEYHSFIGVVNNGQIIHQQVGGDEYISYYGEGVINGDNVWMESATWNSGNHAVINIKNGYYCVNGRGLNVVVFDNLANRVIDSVAFDTHVEENTCTRKKQ